MAEQQWMDNQGVSVSMVRDFYSATMRNFVNNRPIMGLKKKDSGEGLLFMFSPSEVSSTHSAKYSAPKVTGEEAVNEQFSKTDADVWKFTLFLNDYGNYAERTSIGTGRKFLQVEEVIYTLVSWTKPEKLSSTMQGNSKTGYAKQPPILEFFTGFLKVVCTLRELEIKRTMFHPETGRALRATVEITLKEQINPNSAKAKTARSLANVFQQGVLSGRDTAHGNYGSAISRAATAWGQRR